MTSPMHRLSRRAFLGHTGLGLGGAALALLNAESRAGESLAPKKPHHEPRAKHIIYMHMIGGTSPPDLLDPKPALAKWDGKACPEEMTRGKRFAFIGSHATFAASPYRFARQGRSGQEVSELLPHFAKVVDDVCVIRSMRT